jgi:hypothetical protein
LKPEEDFKEIILCQNQLDIKLKRFQNVRKDMYGDQLEKNVSRRDNKKVKVKEKEKLEDKDRVQWAFLKKRILQCSLQIN